MKHTPPSIEDLINALKTDSPVKPSIVRGATHEYYVYVFYKPINNWMRIHESDTLLSINLVFFSETYGPCDVVIINNLTGEERYGNL